MKHAVIKTGGKQYLIKENDEIYVDRLPHKVNDEVEFDTLAGGDFDTETIELGTPFIPSKVKGKIVENLKGDKLRIIRFKSKVRYRKRKGFRPHLTKIKIIRI